MQASQGVEVLASCYEESECLELSQAPDHSPRTYVKESWLASGSVPVHLSVVTPLDTARPDCLLNAETNDKMTRMVPMNPSDPDCDVWRYEEVLPAAEDDQTHAVLIDRGYLLHEPDAPPPAFQGTEPIVPLRTTHTVYRHSVFDAKQKMREAAAARPAKTTKHMPSSPPNRHRGDRLTERGEHPWKASPRASRWVSHPAHPYDTCQPAPSSPSDLDLNLRNVLTSTLVQAEITRALRSDGQPPAAVASAISTDPQGRRGRSYLNRTANPPSISVAAARGARSHQADQVCGRRFTLSQPDHLGTGSATAGHGAVGLFPCSSYATEGCVDGANYPFAVAGADNFSPGSGVPGSVPLIGNQWEQWEGTAGEPFGPGPCDAELTHAAVHSKDQAAAVEVVFTREVIEKGRSLCLGNEAADSVKAAETAASSVAVAIQPWQRRAAAAEAGHVPLIAQDPLAKFSVGLEAFPAEGRGVVGPCEHGRSTDERPQPPHVHHNVGHTAVGVESGACLIGTKDLLCGEPERAPAPKHFHGPVPLTDTAIPLEPFVGHRHSRHDVSTNGSLQFHALMRVTDPWELVEKRIPTKTREKTHADCVHPPPWTFAPAIKQNRRSSSKPPSEHPPTRASVMRDREVQHKLVTQELSDSIQHEVVPQRRDSADFLHVSVAPNPVVAASKLDLGRIVMPSRSSPERPSSGSVRIGGRSSAPVIIGDVTEYGNVQTQPLAVCAA